MKSCFVNSPIHLDLLSMWSLLRYILPYLTSSYAYYGHNRSSTKKNWTTGHNKLWWPIEYVLKGRALLHWFEFFWSEVQILLFTYWCRSSLKYNILPDTHFFPLIWRHLYVLASCLKEHAFCKSFYGSLKSELHAVPFIVHRRVRCTDVGCWCIAGLPITTV